MFLSLFAGILPFVASVVAQSSPTVVCVAGQCLEGFSNTTIGVKLSSPNTPAGVLLLPGQYTSTTNPQLLHSLLTSPSVSLSTTPGFGNFTTSSTISLPLNVALQPGLVGYSSSLYSGQAAFVALPSVPLTNSSSTPLSVGSLAIPSGLWVAVSSGSTNNSRVILWDSIPDVTQLPTTASSPLNLLEMQSSACSPPCAGNGLCTAAGTCECAPGFNGTSCETCAAGFFGPTCQTCPAECATAGCDEGISGSGRCLTQTVVGAPGTCNCLNGACEPNGQCTCNPGWTAAANGTACASCESGFFETSDGNCQVCALGCTQCAPITGDCISCASGFTQNANDQTQCTSTPSVTSTGQVCPDGSFSTGTACTPCSPECQTCSGGTSNDCIICGAGKYSSGGNCVAADANGVCEGSSLIADNNKHECDTCGAKCTTCAISGFNVASTVSQLQCTGCLPGFVLSKGACVASCPSGTFLSPTDNLTCTACDASCGTCVGSSTFCLTCTSNQLASAGKCVSSCPSNTFSSSGSCITCHPDCASCSGPSFDQCTSCSASSGLPALTNGRCLGTCSQTQFFDKTSSSCVACDGSCQSCAGAGPGSCLACSGAGEVLRGGTCVAADCTGNSSVVTGLGVCLSDLVEVPQASGTSAAPPLPTITGLNTPTVITATRRPLAWWEILLMALGCAFIFMLFLMCWRRRARKQREKRTAKFASAKALDRKEGWRWRLVRFGERLFGHRRAGGRGMRAGEEDEVFTMAKMRGAEEARGSWSTEKLIGVYANSHSKSHSRAGSRLSGAPSVLPPLNGHHQNRSLDGYEDEHQSRLSSGSMYSQVTGVPRRTPEPRQPVRKPVPTNSRYSSGTYSFSSGGYSATRRLTPPPAAAAAPVGTDAEEYASAVRAKKLDKNPFRR